MDFVEAMGIMKRMCTETNSCDECPMNEKIEDYDCSCMGFFMRFPEEAEEILAKWNAEHSVKTLKSVFNGAFPNAAKRGGCVPDVPAVCVSKVGYTPICQSDECCEQNCIKCWNQPYDKEK